MKRFFKFFWKGGKAKPFSISGLSKKDWERVKKCDDLQCGLTGWFAKYIVDIPDTFKSIFRFNCKKHDLGFRRGGGLWDFIESNYYLYTLSFKDLIKWFIVADKPIVNKTVMFIYLFASVHLMVIAIFVIGLFAFEWGEYKTLDEILEKAGCK